MMEWLRALLLFVFRRLRTVLYPPSETVLLTTTTAQETYVMASVAAAGRECGVRPVNVSLTSYERGDAHDQCHISTSTQFAVPGLHTACRYIGTHSGLCPSDPESCLLIDSALETLSGVLESRASTSDLMIEAGDADTPSLFGFVSPTVADYAWFGYLEWRHKHEIVEEDAAMVCQKGEDDTDEPKKNAADEKEGGDGDVGDAEDGEEEDGDARDSSGTDISSECVLSFLEEWHRAMRVRVEYSECLKETVQQTEVRQDDPDEVFDDHDGGATTDTGAGVFPSHPHTD